LYVPNAMQKEPLDPGSTFRNAVVARNMVIGIRSYKEG